MRGANKRHRGGVKRLRTQVTFEDLKRIDSSETRRTDTPKTLFRSAINIANQAFQWRPDAETSVDHVRTLVAALGTGKPLERVLVVPVGRAFYLVEGHHRMDAYATVNWRKPIPVEVYAGPLSDARDEAFARNCKDKLPMSTEAKLEAAWKRFNEGGLSWSALVDRFYVAKGTVARMSKKRKELLADGKNPSEVLWRDARRHGWKSDEDFNYEAHKSEKALKMAEELRKISHFFKDPEITALAIATVSPDGAKALAEHLRDADEAALEAWEDQLNGSEETEAPEEVVVDIVSAAPVVARLLEARGHGELAQQLADALREDLEDPFRL